jgi:flavodoxin
MIEISINKDYMRRAREKASTVGILQGSITGGTSNVVGAIGEIIVADSIEAKQINTYDYDLVKDGVRIDVKTKRCNTRPLPNYDCSVALHGTKQDCDAYVFVRILTDLSKAWILGGISKQSFYKKATLYRKGDVDSDNGFMFKADCYNLKIDKLSPVHEIKK